MLENLETRKLFTVFTPANGGHWVVTRHELMDEICRDDVTFSNARTDIPNSQRYPDYAGASSGLRFLHNEGKRT